METPETCLTNVLKIDNLSRIPYHVYVPTIRRPNPAHDNTQSSFLESSLPALHNGERLLRQRNMIGLSDLEKGELWFFDIDIDPSQDAKLDHLGQDTIMINSEPDRTFEASRKGSKRLPQFPPEWGLRESREGIFLASSVDRNGAEDRVKETLLGGTSAANAIDLTDGEHSESDPSLMAAEAHSDSPKTIYRYLITSILSAITHSCAKSTITSTRYIPLNIRTIAQLPSKNPSISSTFTTQNSLPTPPNSAGGDNDHGTFETGRGGILIFTLTAYLSGAGTLCVAATGRKNFGFGSLASLNFDERQLNAVKARDIWLAPWGGIGSFLELLAPAGASPVARCSMTAQEKRWAVEVRSYLADRGIELSEDENQWARVAVWLPSQSGEDKLKIVVWPLQTCFTKFNEDEEEQYSLPAYNSSAIHPNILNGETTVLLPAEESKVAIQTGNQGDVTFAKIFDDDEYLQLGRPRQAKFSGKIITDPGATWFGGQAIDPIDFAARWRLGASERERIAKANRQQREHEMQVKADIAASKQAEDLKGKMKEELETFEDSKHIINTVSNTVSNAVSNTVAGVVYPTPPDGQAPSNSEEKSDAIPEPTLASSIDSGSLPDAGNTSALDIEGPEMDIDWVDDQGHVPGMVAKARGSDSLSGMGGIGDLFDGMDDDIFAAEVTDKDFDFFDEPAFEGTLDGGMGLELNSGANPSSAPDTAGIGNTSDQSDINAGTDVMIDFGGDPSALSLQDLGLGMSIHAQGMGLVGKPDLLSSTDVALTNTGRGFETASSAVRIDQHLQTPPLSPNRMLKILLPDFAKTTVPPQDVLPPLNTLHTNKFNHKEHMRSFTLRRLSVYSPITFTSNVELADRKYMAGGRFFVPPPKETEKSETLNGKMASVSLLDSSGHRRRSIRRSVGSLTPSRFQQREIVPDKDNIEMIDEEEGDSEYEYVTASSSESDDDDESELEYSQPPPVYSPMVVPSVGMKRKRPIDDDGDLAMTECSQRHTPTVLANQPTAMLTGPESELAPPPWQIMVPDPDDYSLLDVLDIFACDIDSSSNSTLSNMTDSDYTTVSKILSDQVITATLLNLDSKYGLDGIARDENDEGKCLRSRRKRKGENEFEDIVKGIFAGASRCTVQQYAEIPNARVELVPSVGRASVRPIAQPRRNIVAKQPTSTNSSELSTSPSTFRIPPPHVHVHRGDMGLEISPVALKFWETFALGPCSGPKNIISFCVYPGSEAMTAAADEFMERMGTVYDSCRLGAYVRGNVDDIKEGLVSIQMPKSMEKPDLDLIVQVVKEACIKFGTTLANVADELQNVVVYIINPFSTHSALIDICYSFLHLQRAYSKAIVDYKDALPNHLVLQIVPMSFVAAKQGLVTPSQEEYIRFALEVYNRCMPTDSLPTSDEVRSSSSAKKKNDNAKITFALSSLSCMSGAGIIKTRSLPTCFAPSITLAKPPPKTISFKLSAEFEPAIVQDSCLHVAYQQSEDERWVSVAWSDNWGECQANDIFCLGRKGCTVLKPWEEISKEIWSQTIELIKQRNLPCNVVITKVGVMEEDEVQIWKLLSSESGYLNSHTLTLLSADPNPYLSLVPLLPSLLSPALNGQQNQFTTPASTPQPSTASPDPSGAINTGGGTPSDMISDLDAEAHLIDYTDEIWGVILNHRLPHSLSAVSDRKSRASGYLIKRTTTGEGDPYEPSVIAIGLVDYCSRTNNKNSVISYSSELGAGGSSLGGNDGSGNNGRGFREDLEMLRDILGTFRGLVTLAHCKGVVDGRSVEPWHIACVRKGVGALSKLL